MQIVYWSCHVWSMNCTEVRLFSMWIIDDIVCHARPLWATWATWGHLEGNLKATQSASKVQRTVKCIFMAGLWPMSMPVAPWCFMVAHGTTMCEANLKLFAAPTWSWINQGCSSRRRCTNASMRQRHSCSPKGAYKCSPKGASMYLPELQRCRLCESIMSMVSSWRLETRRLEPNVNGAAGAAAADEYMALMRGQVWNAF